MNIEKGYKVVLSKENGKSHVEITRHKVSYMDNILIINSIGNSRYQDVWIIEKDLETWIYSIKREGLENIKIIKDVEAPKKNNKKKK